MTWSDYCDAQTSKLTGNYLDFPTHNVTSLYRPSRNHPDCLEIIDCSKNLSWNFLACQETFPTVQNKKLSGKFSGHPETFRLSVNFLDCLENLQTVWTVKRLFRNLQYCFERFQPIWKSFRLFGHSPELSSPDCQKIFLYRNFPECSNPFQAFWKPSWLPRNFPGCPEISGNFSVRSPVFRARTFCMGNFFQLALPTPKPGFGPLPETLNCNLPCKVPGRLQIVEEKSKNSNFTVSVDCQVGSWGLWTSCTATCGGGTKERTRCNQDNRQ